MNLTDHECDLDMFSFGPDEEEVLIDNSHEYEPHELPSFLKHQAGIRGLANKGAESEITPWILKHQVDLRSKRDEFEYPELGEDQFSDEDSPKWTSKEDGHESPLSFGDDNLSSGIFYEEQLKEKNMRLFELDLEKLEAEDSYVSDQDDLEDHPDGSHVANDMTQYGGSKSSRAEAPEDTSEIISKIDYMQEMGLSASDKRYDPEKLMNITDPDVLKRIYDKVMGNVSGNMSPVAPHDGMQEGATGAAVGSAVGEIGR